MAENYVSRKVLYILHYLQSHTDENRGVTAPEIIMHLNDNEIHIERKTIYTDINLLRNLGYDILLVKANNRNEYRLVNRNLDFSELKILADTVASSRFITYKKSRELIAKLGSLTSEANARQLSRSVMVESRIKSMNESIFELIDTIHLSINDDMQLRFRYGTIGPDRRRVLHHGGALYQVSPLSLVLSEGNYYMYAWVREAQAVRTYRVDRMIDAQTCEQPRKIPEELVDFDPISQSNESFFMYAGTSTDVTLRFHNSLSHVVFDRFGQDIMAIPFDNHSFSVRVNVMVSPIFLGWLFGFGADVQIIDPPSVSDAYKSQLKDVSLLYGADV